LCLALEGGWIVAGVGAAVSAMQLLKVRTLDAYVMSKAITFGAPFVLTILYTGNYGLFALYLLWPLLRPLSAMALQRRIENACDAVAVENGADPYALSRFLERFEPERQRYQRVSLWTRLYASHPPMRTRILALDADGAYRRQYRARGGR
jgi:Zn-dependent protease with chaperone function